MQLKQTLHEIRGGFRGGVSTPKWLLFKLQKIDSDLHLLYVTLSHAPFRNKVMAILEATLSNSFCSSSRQFEKQQFVEVAVLATAKMDGTTRIEIGLTGISQNCVVPALSQSDQEGRYKAFLYIFYFAPTNTIIMGLTK